MAGTAGLTATESGETRPFTAALNTRPSVVVSIFNFDPGEGVATAVTMPASPTAPTGGYTLTETMLVTAPVRQRSRRAERQPASPSTTGSPPTGDHARDRPDVKHRER